MSFMMMSPVSNQYASDTESLQTDVMRFMAIIGFCLIAILALVRNVEPTQAAASSGAPAQPVELFTPEPAPAAAPAIELAQVVAAIPSPVVNIPAGAIPAEEPSPESEIKSAPEPEPRPAAEIPSAPEPVSEPVSEPEATEEPGLILRFASDGDFLRLIARGDITVYAFRDSDVLSLDESYRFLDSRSPGQVYELLRASIPDHIIAALRQERTEFRNFRWGIALPVRISHQIEQYLATVKHGQLIINRFGEVRHVAAS